jgi:hypothetical protein
MSNPTSQRPRPGGEVSLADLFRREKDSQSFYQALLKLEGAFLFASADMFELGQAYLERYPARKQNKEEVRLGYTVARVAIIEKAILAVDPSRRQAYRAIFSSAKKSVTQTEAIVASAGLKTVMADHDALAAALAALKASIEEMPKGLIKERYNGGMAYFTNILYAMKMNLNKGRLPDLPFPTME